MLGGDKGFRAN